MCFSAAASFITSAGITGASGLTALKANPTKKFLAIIPFLFGIQQFIEGLQWLVVQGTYASQFLGYCFLIFAFVVWPLYLPMTVYKLEKNKARKQLLLWFVALGIFVSLVLVVILLTFPLTINANTAHIDYVFRFPYHTTIAILYVVALCGSLLVSTDKLIQTFGVLILTSAVLSWLIFSTAFASTWCFFAAVLSILVYWYATKRT